MKNEIFGILALWSLSFRVWVNEWTSDRAVFQNKSITKALFLGKFMFKTCGDLERASGLCYLDFLPPFAPWGKLWSRIGLNRSDLPVSLSLVLPRSDRSPHHEALSVDWAQFLQFPVFFSFLLYFSFFFRIRIQDFCWVTKIKLRNPKCAWVEK